MTDTPPQPKPGVIVLELPAQALQVMGQKLPEGINVLCVPPESVQPEFIRLPKAGEVCPVTGLPRSTLVDLLKRAGKAVPVRHLRRPGAVNGIMLIPRQHLINYIHSLPSPEWSGEEEAEGENA